MNVLEKSFCSYMKQVLSHSFSLRVFSPMSDIHLLLVLVIMRQLRVKNMETGNSMEITRYYDVITKVIHM